MARVEPPPPAQVVAAAGAAVVSAAKVGRLLTRSGWSLARRLPGGEQVQREVQRLQDVALVEVRRLLDIPDTDQRRASDDERRAVLLIQNGRPGDEPLRDAMSELLERSVEIDRGANRDYLYGNIMSQLVPDEARILAALSDGTRFAAIDVIAKGRGRNGSRTVLANASSVGRAAGVSAPDATPTYVTRLYRFGLVQFAPESHDLSMQYDVLATDAAVQAAVTGVEASRTGTPKLERKTLLLAPFGREFWSASDPSRAALPSGE